MKLNFSTRHLAIFLIFLLIACLLALFSYRQLSLPKTAGIVKTGISAEASINRDGMGVPSIKAASLNDAWFAVGYAHAQDRLWQLEMQRRIATGSLSEILGVATLDTDKFLRTLGIHRAAQAQYAKLDASAQQALQHYVKGLNAAISHASSNGMLPPEFLILGAKPVMWEPVDSVAWWMMMAWDLGSNWASELLRLRLSAKLTSEQISQVLPLTSNLPGPMRELNVLYKSLGLSVAASAWPQQLLALSPESGIEGVGSNNWVLSGSRTTSGKPLLANDPHLRLQAPALWYLVNIEAEGYQLSGATLPGIPFIVLGRNQYVAWGATNTGSDVQDLFLERFNPADPNSVLGPNGLEPTQLYLETIKIKGEKDLPLNVRTTRRGPLISDVHAASKQALGNSGFGLSLSWTALSEANLTAGVGLKMNLAKSAAEFREALREYVAPTQNIVFADAQGNIGWVTVGNVPIRARDNDLHGLAPAPAWEAKYQWQGYIPFEQWPQEYNPDRGYIVTANNNILPEGYPYFEGAEWALPFRSQRITQMIEAAPKHDAPSMMRMQGDVQSLAFAALMRSMQAHGMPQPGSELGRQALELLKAFDGVMSMERAEPLIANAWQQQLARQLFSDEVGKDFYEDLLRRRDGFGALLLAMATESPLCDNVETPEKESCAQTAAKALDDACTELAKTYGSKLSKWRWGDAHIARSEHNPFGKHKLLSALFDLHIATAGDTYTVNVGRPANQGSKPFTNVHAASMRGVYDLSQPQGSWLMQSTGQSGHRLSSHYSDMKEQWQALQFLNMADQGAKDSLVLVP